ncbi:MAG: ribosome small subunit-dependent GTPase A [Magnetococcus sp. DMHC-6]
MPRKKNISQQLTNRQHERIHAIAQRRMDHARGKQQKLLQSWEMNALGEPQNGLIIAHFGLNAEVEDVQGHRYRCAIRETIEEEPVCGDRVIWRPFGDGEQGVIETLMPRVSVLRRPGAYRKRLTLAANVDLLVITASAPQLNTGLIDRYLVAAGAADIQAMIVINKIDLPHDAVAVENALVTYGSMGYVILTVSVETGLGLETLEAVLGGQTSVFVGPSGVGKSSLIARWIDCSTLKIGAVAESTGRGRQTTTVTKLYHLPKGGQLIDSPGIRAFGLFGVEASQAVWHFRDIAPLVSTCRFKDCRHLQEPDCAVHFAIRKGDVQQWRLDSLQRIVASLLEEEATR